MTAYEQLAGPVAGKGLKVEFGSGNVFVDGVKEWQIQPKTDKKETTAAIDSGSVQWKTYLATLKDATITITLTDTDLLDPGQKALWDNLMNDAGVEEIRLYEDDTHYFFCDAFVESFPIGSKIDDVEGSGTTITLQISDPDGVQVPATAP